MPNIPNKLYFRSTDGSLILPEEAKDGFAVKTTITTGGEQVSMLDRLNKEERQALRKWTDAQPPEPTGFVDLMKWPGWVDAGARAKRESTSID